MFRRSAEDALEEQQRLQEELASRMQHDSRYSNPANRLMFSSSGNDGQLGSAGNPLDPFRSAMFGGNEAELSAAAGQVHSLTSPSFYSRPPNLYGHPRPFGIPQSSFGGMPSPTDPYGRQRYAYQQAQAAAAAAASGASPETRYSSPYGAHGGNFYGRGQAQSELSQEQAILNRAVAALPVEDANVARLSASVSKPNLSASSYLQNKSSPKSLQSSPPPILPNSQTDKSPTGRGGRGKGIRGGRGRGGRGGRGRGAPPKSPAKKKEEGPPEAVIKWFPGSVPLGLEEDKFWLSELQCYLRSNFAEVFAATEEDIAAPMHGRNKPIALGQVGIRCMHCRDDPPSERGQQATSYPSLISGIYNSVQQMLRLHFDCCLAMPVEVRNKIEALKASSSARGGRKQYWIDSSRRIGLIDTAQGIHFGRDPNGPLPPLEGPSLTSKHAAKMREAKSRAEKGEKPDGKEENKPLPPIEPLPPEELFPLVEPDDINLISDYLYLTLEQMQPCRLSEADKVGCYKGRKVGCPGLACKHCIGQAGSGRYFPATEASLSQTTTSQTIMNHVRNCRRCPIEIRENLELMKRARMGPDGKKADRPKHGGRKVFFRRLWCRMHKLPMDDETRRPRRKNARAVPRKPRGPYKKKKRHVDLEGSDEDNDDAMEDEETETEDEEDSVISEDDSDDRKPAARPTKPKGIKSQKAIPTIWHEGCVRLAKSDDQHWLSEMQCYARSELVEVFSLKKNESLDGYNGRKEPSIGQVGIRCAFCKSLPPAERPGGCVYFPDSVSQVHAKVSDLLRLHFPCCPSMPEDVKDTFKSLRGFGAKADGEAEQYWVDAARDIGLIDFPTTPSDWGITFCRDPLLPSPADELDLENNGHETFNFTKTMLVRADDRGICTDQAMLLLRQVKPCQFKKTDKRGGPGSRSRDRVIGYPGVCCRHCTGKNSFGRYFPVSAKNLTDNTSSSLQGHIQSCNRVPEEVKASLAYLMHRSVLQKAELSGSWKKTFFKRVWDRLHVERVWSTADGNVRDDDSASSESIPQEVEDDDDAMGHSGSASDSEEEEVATEMHDMIQSAAVWLCEQEASDPKSRSRTRRMLPSKRTLPFSPKRSRGGSSTAKRRQLTAV